LGFGLGGVVEWNAHPLLAQKKKRNEKSPSAKIVTIRSYPHKVIDNTI